MAAAAAPCPTPACAAAAAMVAAPLAVGDLAPVRVADGCAGSGFTSLYDSQPDAPSVRPHPTRGRDEPSAMRPASGRRLASGVPSRLRPLGGRRTAGERGYWISAVAWSRTRRGMVRSRASAVRRLITKSNSRGCSMGRSAGSGTLEDAGSSMSPCKCVNGRCGPPSPSSAGGG
jgi:hypothetical protein